MRYLFKYFVFIVVGLAGSIGHADDGALTTLQAPIIADPAELKTFWNSLAFGATAVFQTFGSNDRTDARQIGGAYALRPTISVPAWNLGLTAQVNYVKPYTLDPDSTEMQPGTFDNHTVTLESTAFGSWAFGLSSTLPANTAADTLSFKGAVGPYIKYSDSYRRLDYSTTALHQWRSFDSVQIDDVHNFSQSLKILAELSYRLQDRLAVSGGFIVVQNFDTEAGFEAGHRAQTSIDYKPTDDVTTSLGWSLEDKAAVIDGATPNDGLQQAFFDIVVNL